MCGASMNCNSGLYKYQSGFQPIHSTETTLLKVRNDLLLSADKGEFAILILLFLSAAFDTNDHSMLVDRCENWVGIKGTALACNVLFLLTVQTHPSPN